MPHADPIARRRYHKAYFQSHKKEARNRARIKYHRDPAVRQARLSYLSTWKRNKRRFDAAWRELEKVRARARYARDKAEAARIERYILSFCRFGGVARAFAQAAARADWPLTSRERFALAQAIYDTWARRGRLF